MTVREVVKTHRKLLNRWTNACIWEGKFETVADLVKDAYLRGADLRGADLRGAYLQGADLQGADLRGAYLQGAYLRGAYLQGADLRGAYLQGADLQGADLRGADLQGADLHWSSHALISELLYRAAADDVEKRKIAGLVAVSVDWCWNQFLAVAAKDPLGEWALKVLAEYVKDDDGAPEQIRALKVQP